MKKNKSSKRRRPYSLKVNRVARLLKNRVRPIHGVVIAERVGLSNTSEVRDVVSYLRAIEKLPICSTNRGYCWAKAMPQLDNTMRHLRSRRRKITMVLRGLKESVGV